MGNSDSTVIGGDGRLVAAVVLAAGQSRRMGAFKPLLPFGDSTILGTAIITLAALAPRLASCIVVLGHRADEIADRLRSLPIPDDWLQTVVNAEAREGGMISSVRCGLRALLSDPVPALSGPRGPDAVLVALGDQPEVRPAEIAKLIRAHRGGITVPVYGERSGHPIMIDRRFFSEVLSAPSGQTLRDILRRHANETLRVPVETEAVLHDLDTPDDYARARTGG